MTRPSFHKAKDGLSITVTTESGDVVTVFVTSRLVERAQGRDRFQIGIKGDVARVEAVIAEPKPPKTDPRVPIWGRIEAK